MQRCASCRAISYDLYHCTNFRVFFLPSCLLIFLLKKIKSSARISKNLTTKKKEKKTKISIGINLKRVFDYFSKQKMTIEHVFLIERVHSLLELKYRYDPLMLRLKHSKISFRFLLFLARFRLTFLFTFFPVRHFAIEFVYRYLHFVIGLCNCHS